MVGFLASRDLHGRLVPADELGRAVVLKIPVGGTVYVETRRPRNLQHHRLFFALIGLVFENQTVYPTTEDLLDAIKVYVGHAKELRLRDGRIVFVPKSIAFHAMDQAAFSEFYDAVVRVVCEKIIPGLPESDLRRELEEMVA